MKQTRHFGWPSASHCQTIAFSLNVLEATETLLLIAKSENDLCRSEGDECSGSEARLSFFLANAMFAASCDVLGV